MDNIDCEMQKMDIAPKATSPEPTAPPAEVPEPTTPAAAVPEPTAPPAAPKTEAPPLRCPVVRLPYEPPPSQLTPVDLKCGHTISRDKVKTHLHWLNEQGLVTIDSILSTDIATITGRGHDVATGSAKVPGVGAPRPGA